MEKSEESLCLQGWETGVGVYTRKYVRGVALRPDSRCRLHILSMQCRNTNTHITMIALGNINSIRPVKHAV